MPWQNIFTAESQKRKARLPNRFLLLLSLLVGCASSAHQPVHEQALPANQTSSSLSTLEQGLAYVREHPSTEEEVRVQRYLWLDRWIKVLQVKKMLSSEKGQEYWADLTAFISEGNAFSSGAVQKILQASQSALGKNIALFEEYHQLLKDRSPEEAIKALTQVEDDQISDLSQKAQELLSLDKNRAGVPSRKIGVLLPLSGDLQTFGQEVMQAIQLAAQTAYGDGVEFAIEDSGSTTEQLDKAWQKLVTEEKVTAVMGPLTSKDSEFIFERAEAARIPVISLSPKEGLKKFGSYGFQSTLTIEDQVKRVSEFIVNYLKAKKIGILLPDNSYGWDVMSQAKKYFQDQHLEITQMQVYPAGATDFKDQLRRMTRLDFPRLRKDEICGKKGPPVEGCVKKPTDLKPIVDFEVLFVPDSAETAGLMLPTLPYLRLYGVQVVGLAAYNSKKLIERGGDSAEGVILTDGYLADADDIQTKFFREQYERLVKKAPTRLSAEAFDLAMLVVDIMKTSPASMNRDQFRDRLNDLKDFPGVTGNLFSSDQKIRRVPKLLIVRDGDFRQVRLADTDSNASK